MIIRSVQMSSMIASEATDYTAKKESVIKILPQ